MKNIMLVSIKINCRLDIERDYITNTFFIFHGTNQAKRALPTWVGLTRL